MSTVSGVAGAGFGEGPAHCPGCGLPILDRAVYAAGSNWHPRCMPNAKVSVSQMMAEAEVERLQDQLIRTNDVLIKLQERVIRLVERVSALEAKR